MGKRPTFKVYNNCTPEGKGRVNWELVKLYEYELITYDQLKWLWSKINK